MSSGGRCFLAKAACTRSEILGGKTSGQRLMADGVMPIASAAAETVPPKRRIAVVLSMRKSLARLAQSSQVCLALPVINYA